MYIDGNLKNFVVAKPIRWGINISRKYSVKHSFIHSLINIRNGEICTNALEVIETIFQASEEKILVTEYYGKGAVQADKSHTCSMRMEVGSNYWLSYVQKWGTTCSSLNSVVSSHGFVIRHKEAFIR